MRKLGKDAVDLTEKDRNLRAQFAQQVLVPIALTIFQKMERLPIEDLSSFSAFSIDVKALLETGIGVDSEVLNFIERLASRRNEPEVNLIDWRPTIDLSAVGTSITATLSPYLLNMAEVIKLWDCDYLVLSGRPSCLPSIQAIFHKSPPVLPSRIIAMSEYEVESWYPFCTTLEGKIDDPKTTGVVGALLFTVSEGNLKNFHIRTSSLKPASTIKFIGPMSVDKQVKNAYLLFEGKDVSKILDEEITCTMPFQTQTFIGFRQMKVERWKTTPFYQMVFANQRAAERATQRGPYKVTISYSRRFKDEEEKLIDEENEGVLKIIEIVDKEGSSVSRSDLSLSLKSLWDESHWLDSGLFEIN
jgi:hypothetical protein